MIIPNQKQALAELRPHGYDSRTKESSGAGGKVQANRPNRRPRPFTPAGHANSPPTSPNAGGFGGMGT